MSEVPDIVKQLREAEKLGKLESSSQGSHEELEIPKDLLDDMSDENVEGFKENVENREFNIEPMQHSSSSGDSSVDEKELLFQSTSDLMVYIDKHGKIAKINKAGIAFSGFSENEVIGQSFWKMPGVFSKHNIPKYLKVFKNSLKGKPTESFLCELHEKSGKKHVMDFSMYPIKENNKVTSILVVAKDVTEQKETEDKYRLITEKTSDLITTATFTLNPIFTYISPSHKKAIGYEAGDLIGKPLFDFVHPDDKRKLFSLLKRYLSAKAKKLLTGKEAEVSEKVEIRFRDKSGNWRYMETTANLIKNEIVSVSRDVTDRRKAEERTKQQNKINTLRAEIWELAAQPLSENELIQQLLDKVGPFFNVEHASFIRIYPQKNKAIVDVQWRKKESKSGIGEEFPLWVLKRYFGKPYIVASQKNLLSIAKPISAPFFKKFSVKSTILIPYGDVNAPRAFLAAADSNAERDWLEDEINIFSEVTRIIELKSDEITAEKEIKEKNEKLKDAHEMLQVMNSELEQKVKERTETVERLLQQKDEFINQLGHDLKTPLTPLVALTPLLRKHLDGKPEIIKIVDTLVTSANHMKNMVDKTLQLASLNSSQIEFEFEQTNLFTEIKNAIENNQFLFNENNIDVLNMVDEEIIVTADKRQLYEVFTNLFTNAIKYSQENKGSIVIDAEKGKDDEVIISVKDDGIGMTSEQQKFVFDEFYKLDSSRHDLDSSGLGLAICRRIVEHHGGRIWVESPGPGKGCTFYFTLNAWMEKIMDKKILLVDDDPDICLTMKIFFDDAGFDLQVVKNGSECLEELEKGFHGVVLMDVMMPGMNGWDVVREMVDKGYMDGNVVAMFSVAAPSEEDMDGLRDYVAGFISKPFDTEELIEIVNGYFDKLQKS